MRAAHMRLGDKQAAPRPERSVARGLTMFLMWSGGPARAALVAAIAAAISLGACTPANGDAAARPTAPRAVVQRPAGTIDPPRIAIPTDASGALVTMVWMGDHYYSPSSLSVPVGTTVMWRMLGSQEHDVWAYDGSFHSPTLGPGSTFTHTFTKLGTFKYLCTPHSGDGMYGEIVVVPRSGG